jgi:DnaJ like chaperone protein
MGALFASAYTRISPVCTNFQRTVRVHRMSVIVLFALIGLFVGGARGLLIGAAIGYGASWVLRNVLGKRLALVRAQFLDSTFAVMGALCKADGAVSRDEIQVAESMFARLNLSSDQRRSAMAAFTRGKAPHFDLDAEVGKFARASHGHRSILVMFLQIQCAAVAADGNVHPAEHQMLVKVARGLGLSEADVAQLEALLRTGAPGPSPQRKLEDAYTALGLSSSASDAEIKQAYRRLMSQNHPDKLAGKGLPESMREMAEERSREISTAYAVIKEARGFI